MLVDAAESARLRATAMSALAFGAEDPVSSRLRSDVAPVVGKAWNDLFWRQITVLRRV